MEGKKVFVALFILALAAFSAFLLLRQSPAVLVEDEIFYYFQGEKITGGEFVWFENTQPYFYPLFLSAFHFMGLDVTAMRFSSAVFMALSAVLLYFFVRKHFSRRTALLSFFLFTFSIETMKYASLLYTESLFVFLALASFLFYSKFIGQGKRLDFAVFIALVSLAFATKTAGFYLLLVYGADLYRKGLKKEILWLAVPVLAFAPFIFMGGLKFIIEKTVAVGVFSYFDLYYGVFAYGAFFSVLSVLGFFAKGKKSLELKLLVLGYFLLAVLSIKIIFYRYLFLALPLICALIAVKFVEVKNILPKAAMVVLIMLNFAFALLAASTYSPLGDGNRYFFAKDGCFEVKSFLDSCSGRTVETPHFSQPSHSECTYSASFFAGESLSRVYVSYVSDEIIVEANGQSVETPRAGVSTPASGTAVFPVGKNSLELWIRNNENIGGFGQVLVCK